MSFASQALNLTCIVLAVLSLSIFWINRKLESEITQLQSDAETLKIELEKIHKTCQDKIVAAFPRIPATHIVTHSEDEAQELNINTNVTFVLLYITDNRNSWSCINNQIESVKAAFPNSKILKTVVTTNEENIKLVKSVKTVGIFHNIGEALNNAIKLVDTPYFMVIHPNFIIEPKGLDTSIEWLHHALVITPGIDIIGGSVLLANNELVVPCYSLNLCNWTITQKYEYKRSFGEIMICDEVSQSFMARKEIITEFDEKLFDKNLESEKYVFLDFFLRAKQLGLTTANRPEVLFVQQNLCAIQDISKADNMENGLTFARKHQVMQFKNPENNIHSICDAKVSSNICTIKTMLSEFKFPNWYENGMFAFPFVIKQAIRTLEIVSAQLRTSDIKFVLQGETLFGAVMTKSVLPWGHLNAINLSVFSTKTEIINFALTNGYEYDIKGGTIVLKVQAPNFFAPMNVEIIVEAAKVFSFVNVRVNGKLYPAPSDPIAELKSMYGENYLHGESGRSMLKFSCAMGNHHACMPAMPSRSASTYQDIFCKI